jgi:hypothetical protein
MTRLSSLPVLLLLPLALALLGCGAESVQHDSRTTYSPAALAEELAYRYKSARDAQSQKAAAPKSKTLAGDLDEQVATKAADDAAKAQPGASVEAVVAETLKKVDQIKDKPRSEILRDIIDQLQKQPGLSPADREDLAKRLNQ